MPRTDSQEPANGMGVLDKPKTESEASAPAVTDEELIARVSRGDPIAFETLFNRYRKSALRLARRFPGLQNEVEDLAEEAFLRVYHRAHQYNPEAAPFKTWFFRILKNLCRNAVRRNKPLSFTGLSEDAPINDDPEHELAHEELRTTLDATIVKLPPNQRLAFILCYEERFSYVETAAALGCSVKAIESLLARAKQTLRRELAGFKKNL
jgi:RNA polymerase sigma-70 factor (ECF subfamily)